ncbi:MAG: hypothetical protein L0Y72_18590 [Gemmataceae bacterium]|nr:hypothetical protein [Gemmataceae bacterium]
MATATVKTEKQDRLVMLGTAAKLLGCDPWKLHRLFERGLTPQPQRVGRYRVLRVADLPRIKRALEAAGYLEAVA